MDFSWTDEQRALRAEIVRFARENLGEGVREADRESVFPEEQWKRCAEYGLAGLVTPAEYGGRGLDTLSGVLALEGLGYGCVDNGLAFAINAQVCVQQPLIEFGTEEQKNRFLPGLAAGTTLGSYVFTEPEAGSDLYSLTTRAEPVEGGYKLTGRKRLVSLGPRAGFGIVFATVNPERKQWGLTAFLVDLTSEGVSRLPNNEKMGLRTVPLGEIHFEDCFVPAANVLGSEGGGVAILNGSLEWERCIVFATQLGAMERQLEECIQFARTRKQFGQPIGKFQSISNRIAEMKVRLETSRLLLYQVAWMKEAGQKAMLEAVMSKLVLTESFLQSGLDAVLIHGGTGYLSETGVERSLRDAMGGIIYAGTSDIQRNTIAKLLGL